MKTSLGVSNVSFGIGMAARAVLNSTFLHHCVEAGLDLAMVNPNHITPYGEIPDNERELADDLVFNRREDALERFIDHFESKGPAEKDGGRRPDRGDGARGGPALAHPAPQEGRGRGLDRPLGREDRRRPDPQQVLLPAMKEVGDKFGSGELILPFVLQSAEVMKRAVAQLENYLDRIEGHSKGKVVIATVFGDVHDIGKSLVNTILTNNGYTVIDLGKQVPIDQIIDAAVEHEADAIGLSALLVSTSKQMPACIGELHDRGHDFPVLIGGAAINRDFGRRALYPKGKESDEIYEPGVFYCKDAFAGSRHGRRADRRRGPRGPGREDPRRGQDPAREACGRRRRPADHRRQRPLGGSRPTPTSRSRRSGASAMSTSTSTRSFPTSTATSSSSSTGAGAAARERSGGRSSRATTATRASARSSSGCGPSRTTCVRGCGSATSPATPTATSWSIFDPEDHDREIERFVFPRQPRHDRICLADFYRPLGEGRDVVALQARHGRLRGDRADRAAPSRRRVRRAALRPRARRPVGRRPGGVEPRPGPRRARRRRRPGPPLLMGLSGLPRPVRARRSSGSCSISKRSG